MHSTTTFPNLIETHAASGGTATGASEHVVDFSV